ncbi:ADP-ribosylation factor-like protein, partial [Vibrio cyclitrophicus]
MKEIKLIEKKVIEELVAFLSNLNDYSYQFDSLNTDDIVDTSALYRGMQHQHGVILLDSSMLIINSSFMEDWQVTSLLEWLSSHELLDNVIASNFSLISFDQLILLPNLRHLAFSGNIDKATSLPFENLDSLNYEGDDLVNLLECLPEQTTKIRYLELKSSTLDIVTINKMINLEELNISKFDGDFPEDEPLNLPNLSSFTCFRDFNISHLAACPNVLNVNGSLNTELDYSHLVNNIKHVAIGRSLNLYLDNLYLNNIESLNLYSSGSLTNITKPIPSLKFLSIYSPPSRNVRQTREFRLSNLALLENLEHLMLRSINIIDDTDSGFFHKQLKGFDLAHSNINDLSFITKLNNIERLNLPSCKIENIEPLMNMERLTQVYLKNNKIIYIPPELSERFNIIPSPNAELTPFIAVGNNPLISPPIEIVDRGEKAVRPYFNSMVGDMEELNEAKIIFLGNGEVGKTSLMKALSGQNFDSDEATTHGINICKYNVPINEMRSIDAAIWDFGGQQIMHATHQLFLSRRCVYVLVINDRRDDLQQEQKIEYWLQQVQTFGG